MRTEVARLFDRDAIATAVVCVVAFPLAQMYLFGKTDYSRPADVIIVLGVST